MTEDNRPTAYSYVRFSTKKQELGDSLRRQVELAEKYAKENGLALSPQSFRDLGISGFKKQNLEKGALAAFITAVKNGTIKPGSYLLIEQFDRLSRAQVADAFVLLMSLIKAGVTVITLVDKKIWNETTMEEVSNVLVSIILMSRAYEESDMKAKRLREKWGQKKQAAAQGEKQATRRIVTSECPKWLVPNEDKTGFIVDEQKAESVRKVFAARIDLGLGIVAIVSRANAEGWTVPGKAPIRREGETDEEYKERKNAGATWHTSLVGRLLNNRAVLGEYQPYKYEQVKLKGGGEKKVRSPDGEVIHNYYPAILTPETYAKVEGKRLRSGRFPGRRDASLKNWLQGLLRCTCGHSFVRKNKDSKAQPNYARYYCTARNRGIRRPDGTLCPGANAGELENAVIYVISAVAPAAFDGTDRSAELKTGIEVLEVELSAAIAVRERYADSIGDGTAPLQTLLTRLKAAEEAVNAKEAELRKTRAELANLGGNNEEAVATILRAVRGINSLDERAALREELSRLIDKVVVHEPEGYIEVFMRGKPEEAIVQRLRSEGEFPGLTFTPMTEEEHKRHVESWVPPSRVKGEG